MKFKSHIISNQLFLRQAYSLRQGLVYPIMISLIFILGACTGGSSDPVKIHESADSAAAGSQMAPAGATLQVKMSIQQESEIQKIKTLESSKSFADKETYFLDFKNWERTETSQLEEFKSFINSFQRETIETKTAIDGARYSEFFLRFCSFEMQNCKHIRTLKSSPYSAELITQVAEKESDTGRRLQLTLTALEVSNQVPKESTILLLIKDSKKFREYLAKKDSRALLLQVDQYIETALSNSQSGILKIDPETIAKNKNLFDSTSEIDLQLAGKIYRKNIDKSEDLQFQFKTLNSIPTSYVNKYKWLESSAPQFIDQLKVKRLPEDFVLFSLEKVSQRQWTSQQAAAFLKGAGINGSDFEEKAKTYAKSMVAYIVATIQSDLFKSFTKKEGSDKNLFFYDAGMAINPRLVEARLSVDQLKVLVSLVENLQQTANSQFRQLIESLPETFRLGVSDAATLALFDRGIKLDVNGIEKIPVLNSSWSGYKSFNDFFNDLFSGNLEPLIQVLPIPVAKSYFQMNEALEFALRTQYFGKEPTDGDEALSRIFDFYSQIDVFAPNDIGSVETTQTRTSLLNRSLKSLRDYENNSFYNYAHTQCQNLKSNGIMGTFDITSLGGSADFGTKYWQLKSVGKTGSTSSASDGTSIDRATYAIFPANSSQSDTLEWGRLDVLTRAEQFLAIVNTIESDSNFRFPKFKKKMELVKASYAELYSRQYNLIKNFMPCWYKLVHLERENTAQIVKYEKVFWSWVVKPENRQKASVLFSRDLPEGVKYRSRIDAESAAIHNFDLLIRARYYLMYGFPELQLPAISPGINISISSGLGKTAIYKESKISTVKIDSNLESFAINAVRASGLKGDNSSVDWFSSSFMPSTIFSLLLDVANSLYRMAPLAKDLLKVNSVMPVEEFIKINSDIFAFINLTESEREALAILGESKRLFSVGQMETPYLHNAEGKYLSVTENISRYLVSDYMGSFGNPAIWEDPKSNMGLSRPRSLMPLPIVAKLLKYYNQSKVSFGTHLYADSIKSTQMINNFWNSIFKMDLENRDLAMKAMKAQKPFQLSVKIDENVELSGYNSFILDDLKNRLEDFKKYLIP